MSLLSLVDSSAQLVHCLSIKGILERRMCQTLRINEGIMQDYRPMCLRNVLETMHPVKTHAAIALLSVLTLEPFAPLRH